MVKILTETEFHEGDAPVYLKQQTETNTHFKYAQGIANVTYHPAHKNVDVPEKYQGKGKLLGKWLYNEQADKKERLLTSTIELFMDSTLAPNASVGLHEHTDSEELYYLLEGELQIELIDKKGAIIKQRINPGDTHLIQPGESHFIQAGAEGARFIVVAATVEPDTLKNTENRESDIN